MGSSMLIRNDLKISTAGLLLEVCDTVDAAWGTDTDKFSWVELTVGPDT